MYARSGSLATANRPGAPRSACATRSDAAGGPEEVRLAPPPSPEAIPDCIAADVRLILDPTTAVMHVLPRGRRVIR